MIPVVWGVGEHDRDPSLYLGGADRPVSVARTVSGRVWNGGDVRHREVLPEHVPTDDSAREGHAQATRTADHTPRQAGNWLYPEPRPCEPPHEGDESFICHFLGNRHRSTHWPVISCDYRPHLLEVTPRHTDGTRDQDTPQLKRHTFIPGEHNRPDSRAALTAANGLHARRVHRR